MDCLVQDFIISIASALEILQSCIKPSICHGQVLACFLQKEKKRLFDVWFFAGPVTRSYPQERQNGYPRAWL